MDIEPIWYKYATFGDDGFVNGVSDDAPESIKEAYNAYIKEKRREMQRKKPMPKQ